MWIYEEFERSVARNGERPFLHVPAVGAQSYAHGAIELSYAEVHLRVAALRAEFARKGYGLGQRLALLLDNRAEFFVHFLALNSLGVSIVPIHPELLPEEMAYLIDHSEVCAAVSLPEHLERTAAAAALTSRSLAVVTEATELPRADRPTGEGKPGEESEAAMVYTSGTTGKPKGCILSNAYFVGFGHWYGNLGGHCQLRPGRERLITPLPVSHMNALACSFMAMLVSGGCLVQLDRFHPSTWWQAVRDSAATIIHYLGVMPAILLGAEPRFDDDLSRQVRFGFGAGIDPRHHQAFEERFGFPLIEAWAMTETGCGAYLVANSEPRHVGSRCIGRATSDVECRLVEGAGDEVPPGTPGELLVRAAGDNPRRFFFGGYFKDRAATEQAWAGGWFHTGDVVRIAADGSFHFVDRRKNIIRRSGENIAAVEVEGVLSRHPAVENCAVTAVSDEIRGEEVMACIRLHGDLQGSIDTAREIFSYSREKLSYHKSPGYIAFVNELPTTASQKIRRGEIRKLAASLLAAGASFDLRAAKRRPRRGGVG